MDLTTNYMGLQLKNPLVASASPLSADLGNIRHLEDSGAAAIVLPSIFEEQIEADRLHKTLAAVDLEHSPEAHGHLAEANQREPQQYLDLVRRAVEAVDIPIIGSLNGTTEEGWISYAKMIEEAGATSLELNVYLIPTDISLTVTTSSSAISRYCGRFARRLIFQLQSRSARISVPSGKLP